MAATRVENAELDVAAAKKEGNANRIKEAMDIQARYEKAYKDLEDQYYKLAREVNIREYELKVHEQEGVLAERKQALKQNPDDASARKAALEAEQELLTLRLALKTYREEDQAAEVKTKAEAPITVDFVQKDIQTIMHYIALKSGLQIVVQGEIEVEVTVMYKDVDPKKAIKSICKEHGLDMFEDGNVIIIKKGAKRYDFTFEGTLGDAIESIKDTTGVVVRADKSLRDEHEAMLFLKQATVREVLDLLCESLELSLVVIGDGHIIRHQLADCRNEMLSTMIEDHRAEADALEMHIQFATIVVEGARETGDKDAVEEAEERLRTLEKTKADYEAELTALNAELEKRDR